MIARRIAQGLMIAVGLFFFVVSVDVFSMEQYSFTGKIIGYIAGVVPGAILIGSVFITKDVPFVQIGINVVVGIYLWVLIQDTFEDISWLPILLLIGPLLIASLIYLLPVIHQKTAT